MRVSAHNRLAWNRLSRGDSEWAKPVDRETIERARHGEWTVILTPHRAVPRSWLGDVTGRQVLCLASGGGQQAPVLAAAGAHVVSFDLSEEQLRKDRLVAEREGLSLSLVRGDMADLSTFGNATFDLVFNPISTVFVPDVAPVWRECFRVLRPGGALLTGFLNPSYFLFDHDEARAEGSLVARYRLPYSEEDLSRIGPDRCAAIERGEAMEFGHTLEALLGGLLDAGFIITGFYEDTWSEEETLLDRYSPTSMATRAQRPLR